MASDVKSSNPPALKNDLDFLKLQYQVLSDRRINHNTLLWNVPSMFFIAQTFMWTIAISDCNNVFIRCGISLLSIIVSYISYQLFERSRLMEVLDAEQMYSVEKYFEIRYGKANIMIIHNKPSERTLFGGTCTKITDFINNHSYYKHHNKKSSLCQKVSSDLWKIVFVCFFIMSCAILVYNIVKVADFISSL